MKNLDELMDELSSLTEAWTSTTTKDGALINMRYNGKSLVKESFSLESCLIKCIDDIKDMQK